MTLPLLDPLFVANSLLLAVDVHLDKMNSLHLENYFARVSALQIIGQVNGDSRELGSSFGGRLTTDYLYQSSCL